MKKLFGLLCAISLLLSVPGCGRSDENSSVAEGAAQSDIEAYQSAVEAEAAEMDAAPPTDSR